MNLRQLFVTSSLAFFATGCAFFDEPADDIGSLIPSQEPAIESPAPQPTPRPVPAPLPTPQPAAKPADREVANQPDPAPASVPASQSPGYLVVAPIDRFPRDAQNIAVVHLTDRSTRRELALCKALMQNMPVVDVQDLPAKPLTVVVWPVPNDNAGANCIEMISEFEAIDLTPEAEKRVKADANGPFLLTRNLPTGKRMIYDTSFIANSALSATLNKWVSLLGSAPADWPEYRRAR